MNQPAAQAANKSTTTKPAASKPNFLLITSDQQHWSTLGVLNPRISTPHLDRLAREGAMFTRAYCPNPYCTPSRASIITGRYPSQHGAWALGTKLPESEITVGEQLQQGGYRTALVGKAHFQPIEQTSQYSSIESYQVLHDWDYWRGFSGPYYGFEHVELVRNHTNEDSVGQHYALWMESKGLANWRDYYMPPTGTMDPAALYKWPIPERFHYNAWIAERTGALLTEYKERGDNFFLWASFPDPHPKYLVPEPWDTMYDPDALDVPGAEEGEHETSPRHIRLTQQPDPDYSAYMETGFEIQGLAGSHLTDLAKRRKAMAVYYGMVSMMDKYIGRILDDMDRLGLADNTVVVFTSDHGHFFGQHGLNAKGPFHYQDGIKIPFIVKMPGQTPSATFAQPHQSLQSLVDLAPTFLKLASLPIPGAMTGVDQSDVWRGTKAAARNHAICEDRHEPKAMHLKTYVNNRYRLTVYFGSDEVELYDLQDDPDEIRNLWAEPGFAELKRRLMLDFLQAEMGKEPMWMPRISPW